jgi:hypothetical protein
MDINIENYIKTKKNYKNKYVKYDDIYIKDDIESENNRTDNELEELTKKEKREYKQECIKICANNKDCVGLNIDDENSCGLIKKLDGNNKIIRNEHNTSYIKRDAVKKYDDNKGEDYMLKLNDNSYIKSKKVFGLDKLISTKNIKKANEFMFNKNGNIIDKETSKCIQKNGIYYILTNCDPNIEDQKFIVENELNTLRDNKNNCMTKNMESGEITSSKCNNYISKKNNNQRVILGNTKENYETAHKNKFKNRDADDSDEIDSYNNKTHICENYTYKIIINVVFGIIVLILFNYVITIKKE